MAARRAKRSLKAKPKYQQARSLKCRKRKAKMRASKKRGLNRIKKRRRARDNKLRMR